jgi:S-layer protein
VDSVTGTAGSDTITGNTALAALTLTSLDSIDGGAGADTLNIAVTGAANLTAAVGSSISNVETLNLSSTGAVTIDATGYTGMETVSSSSVGNSTLTASATTDIVAAAAAPTGAGAIAINGGRNITATSTDTAVAGTASGNTTVIGASARPAGTVVVSQTETITDAAAAGVSASATGSITVNGGTSVNVTSLATLGTAENVGDIVTIGDVTVNGRGTATDVTVTQQAQTIAFNGTTQTKIKATAGAVAITDLNTALKADTIKTVSLSSFGNSTHTGNVLETVNLTGGGATTASGTFTISQSNGITTAGSIPTELTANVNGVVAGLIDTNDQYKTLNISTAVGGAIASLDATSVTDLNISGAKALTISAIASLGALATIDSTGAGVTITPTLQTGQTFTGGDGVEKIQVGAQTTAIALGAGDDQLTMTGAAFGTGGSADGGEGTDKLVMTAASAVTASATAAFEAKISNFEKLTIGDVAATGAVAMNNLDDISDITVAGVQAGQVLTISGVNSGVNVTFADATQTATTVTLASDGSADVANITLATADNASTHSAVTLTGFETMNIVSSDIETTRDLTDALNDISITNATATTINVSGNAGGTITHTGTKVASFDASGVTAGPIQWTSGALTVATTVKGGADNDILSVATATKGATMYGGAGNDQLTGDANGVNTLWGEAGNDTLTGGSKADTINGGAGKDTYVGELTEQAGASTTVGMVINLGEELSQSGVFTTTANYLSSAGATVAPNTAVYLYNGESTTNAVVVDTLIDIENATGGTGTDYIVGSDDANTITGGAGADDMTGGKGVDTFVFGATDSIAASATNAAVAGDATEYEVGDTITFGNGVDIVTDFTAGEGGDVLKGVDAGAPTSAIDVALATTTGLAAGTTYFLSGTYVASTGVFTVTADGATGSSTLIIEGAGNAVTANTEMVLLVGVDSDSLVAANLVA